jgi:hypothetical protein
MPQGWILSIQRNARSVGEGFPRAGEEETRLLA